MLLYALLYLQEYQTLQWLDPHMQEWSDGATLLQARASTIIGNANDAHWPL